MTTAAPSLRAAIADPFRPPADDDEWDHFFQQNKPLLWRTVHRAVACVNGTVTKDVIENAFQHACLAVYHQAPNKYDPQKGVRFRTFAVNAAFIAARNFVGRWKDFLLIDGAGRVGQDGDDDDGEHGGDAMPEAPEAVEPELEWAMESFMSKLPSRLREILRLRYWEELTLAKTGERLELSTSAVYKLEKRALSLAAKELADWAPEGVYA